MSAPATDRTLGKRQRILDAARSEILRHGLRGTTMEALAKAAGVAKPTLYKHFSDKDAVFEALVDDLILAKTEAFEAGFATPGPVKDRLARGIAAKFGTVAELLEGSPHADELINAHHRLANRIRLADSEIASRVSRALSDAGVEDAEALTAILFAAASGFLNKFTSAAQVRDAIMILCERMILVPEGARS